MIQLIRGVFYIGPLIFAFGFLFPLLMQTFQAFGMAVVLGISSIWVSLAVAGGLGLLAQIRGRWI